MNFAGSTDDPIRNQAQQDLFKNIGNDSTRPRSIELGIRAEAALFERLGKRNDKTYAGKVQEFVSKLTDKAEGFELNRRLLCGELTPEKWVEDMVPEKLPELVKTKKKKNDEKSEDAKTSDVAPPPLSAAPTTSSAPTSAPAPAPMATEPSSPSADSPVPSSTSESERKALNERSSYYYFSSTDPEKAKAYVPKPIDPEEAKKVAEEQLAKGMSAWNKGGTWEEKDLSKWGQRRMKEILSEIEVPEFDDGTCAIESGWTVTCEASVVFIRGQKRVGYEISANTSFSGEYKGQTVKGKIDIPCFDETEGNSNEFEVNFSCSAKGSEATEVIKRAVKKAEPLVRERVQLFIKELKEK